MVHEQPQCPCCNATEITSIGRLPDATQFAGKILDAPLPGGILYQCSDCRLKFRFPVQDVDAYRRLYDTGQSSAWTNKIVRHDWERIVEKVDSAGVRNAKVLDFGCNTGGLLAALGNRYERFGIEINHAAAAVAAQRAGAQVWSDLDDVPQESRFDFIVVVDVIEHVENPLMLIDRLSGFLTTGGRLIVTTGDAGNVLWNRFGANWWYCFHSEHISFVSKPWLHYLVDNRELNLVAYERFRYRKLSPIRFAAHGILMVLYGFFPSVYLGLGNVLKRLRSRPPVASVLGNGISRDHLLFVLSINNDS